MHDQLFELMRGLDKDCDSTIDIQEFASRFEPVFTRLNLKQDVSAIVLDVYGTTCHLDRFDKARCSQKQQTRSVREASIFFRVQIARPRGCVMERPEIVKLIQGVVYRVTCGT